uniref:Small ribosomal subunit protein RACK1 n=1 Tax=Dendroctonus ponderosae TaxID=77166 RepID=J3JZ99_DENPD|nr:unknown [Dendroctonus ponderosae]
MDSAVEEPRYLGCLEGHGDWVTCVRTAAEEPGIPPNTVFSSSRDKKVMIWRLNPTEQDNEGIAGYALRSLSGHSQAIQDLALSSNSKYVISASWDSTIRLWDVEKGNTIRTFKGHTSDVNSVALSPDNRQIVSGSRDKTIKLWNTVGECKYTFPDSSSQDWISCTRFSPLQKETLIVSGGWDKKVRVWNLEKCSMKTQLGGHTGAVYTITISPDGSLCASGGKDGVAMLWDVNEGRHLYSIAAQSAINCLCFSPSHYWLCAATDDSIKIWNLEEGKAVVVNLTKPRTSTYDEEGKLISTKRLPKASGVPWCVSLTWSADGRILYAGATDGKIHVYEFSKD